VAPGFRYRLDGTVRRFGNVLIGGSPLKLFRLTEAGNRVVDRIEAGEFVADSGLVTTLVDGGAIHPHAALPVHDESDVTIVTPTLGVPEHVAATAIVVDDGSAPPVPNAAVRLARNQGPAAARNAGLALVETPLVAFVDADVDLPEGWLIPLLEQFADPRVALVAPRVRTTGDSTIAAYERGHSPLDLGAEAARIASGTRVGYVPAAAIVCRVEAIRAIGGFDESLRFGEDVDLVWRLADAGWRCRYEPASEVHHEARPSWTAWVRQRVDYGSSAAALARRHLGALTPLRMNGWSLSSWLIGVTVNPLIGVTIGFASSAALVAKLPDVPPRVAFELAATGNARAGEQIARAIRRVWWPLLALTAIRSKAARRLLVVAALAVRHPVTVVDDIAYSVGVWRGMARERTIAPLVPEIVSWPGPGRTHRAGRTGCPNRYRPRS